MHLEDSENGCLCQVYALSTFQPPPGTSIEEEKKGVIMSQSCHLARFCQTPSTRVFSEVEWKQAHVFWALEKVRLYREMGTWKRLFLIKSFSSWSLTYTFSLRNLWFLMKLNWLGLFVQSLGPNKQAPTGAELNSLWGNLYFNVFPNESFQ